MIDSVEDSLPRGVALTWGVAERPQRGPKRELSIERIVEAAIALADGEDLSAVSMGRVAASLGFTTMSLYRYVTSKDDLLMLMQDAVCGIPLPPDSEQSDWRAGLREWVNTTMTVYRDHLWFVEIPISSVPMTPNNLAFLDWGLRCLRDLPLNDTEKMSVMLLVSGFARSFGSIEAGMRRAELAGASKESVSGASYAAALKELVTEERFPHLHPLVQTGVYTDDPSDGHDDIAFGLERILDGIQHYLDRPHDQGRAVDDPGADRKKDRSSYLDEPYPKDAAVREAARMRRDAEVKLREAVKREREVVGHARERAKKEAEADARRAAKAAR